MEKPSVLRLGLAAVLLNAVAAQGMAAVALCEKAIGLSLRVPLSEEIWLAEAFLLAATLAVPLTPWLIERLGPRRTLLLCVSGFLAASLASLLSRTLEGLLVGLFVQGLATAPLLPLTQSMLANLLPESRRGLGMALWNAGNVLGVLVGSLGAEAAIERGDWDLIFWLGWPLALGGLGLAWGPRVRPTTRRAFDGRGFALMGAAAVALTLGLNLISRRGQMPWVLVVVGVACTCAYVWHARRHPHPLLDLKPLRIPSCGAAVFMSLAYNVLCAGQMEANYLVTEMQLSAAVMTLRNTLGSLASLAGVALAGLAFDGLVILSLAVTLVGKTGILLYRPDSSPFAALWPMVVCNLGYWMVATALSVLLLRGVEPPARPAAASLFALSATLGNTVGLALLDGFFEWRSQAVHADRAFHEVFGLEWLGIVPLLLIALRFRRRHG